MSDSLRFNYTLTEQHYARAVRACMWLQLWWRIMLIVFGLVVAMLAILSLAGVEQLEAFWFGTLAGGGAGLAVAAMFWVWQPRYLARNSPSVGVEIEVTISPEGVSARSAKGNTDFRWSMYTAARETTEFFLFFSGKGLFYPCPKSAFADSQHLDRFRNLVRTHVPDAKLLDHEQRH